MRPHILLAFLTLFVSACASHQHEGPNRNTASDDQQKADHNRFVEGPGARFR